MLNYRQDTFLLVVYAVKCFFPTVVLKQNTN